MTFFAVKPIDGTPYGVEIPEHSKSDVDSFIKKASASASTIAAQSPQERALLLRRIAAEIEAIRESLSNLLALRLRYQKLELEAKSLALQFNSNSSRAWLKPENTSVLPLIRQIRITPLLPAQIFAR